MSADFTPRHIPALCIATLETFGGVMSIFNAEKSISAFGLPPRIAVSKSAHPVMIVGTARTTAIGLALFTFYFSENFAAVDTVLSLMSYVALVDALVLWKEGIPGKAAFRLAVGLAVGGWGWVGGTAGSG